MTTENVTVLFTDLVGSTELASSLTPQEGDEVRRGHFSALRQAIAEAGGTEVKSLGDGLMVVFPTASAAVSCAVAMQQAVDRDNRSAQHPLGLRVGLSAGEVTREGDDYFGEPVIEAARLCARSSDGQILVTDLVRAMGGRRSPHAFSAVGELELKGLPKAVETDEVDWEPLGDIASATTVVPLPARLEVRPATGVIGRDTEAALLADAFKRAAMGDGREIALVSGEAGVGKTTLASEVARSAFDAGGVVLLGRCDEDLGAPYGPFVEALQHYVSHAPEELLRSHVQLHGGELGEIVPALRQRLGQLPAPQSADPDTERYLLFSAVIGLLAQVSEAEPLVIMFDDLQSADKGSLLLLRHLATSEQAMRLLVLVTYRDTELSRSHPLTETLAGLRYLNGVTRIELAGLDDTGVVAFFEAAAGQMMDDAGVGLAHAVYRETDGNPFFVSEVLRHLAETRAIYQDASGRWISDGSLEHLTLPDSVRQVIGARVGRLGKSAERVLSMAAVIGRDFDLDVLARVTKTSEDDLLDTLDAAASVALVREVANIPGRYNFAHALIQHTLYEDLGPTRRARAHRQVGEVLEELCGDRPGDRVGELARHWTCATQTIDVARAILYNRQAGEAALAALAPADALRYYAPALDLFAQAHASDVALGVDLAIGLGTAQRQTGDPAFRDTLLDAAHRAADLGDTQRLVAAALANDRGWFSVFGTIDTKKVEVLEMALDRLATNHPDRALVLATLCSELAIGAPLDRRQALADEAVAFTESSSDDALTVRVLNHVLVPLMVPPLLGQSLAWTADALTRAERVGDPVLLFSAAQWRSFAASRAGDIDEMDRCCEVTGTLAEQLDQAIFKWAHNLGLTTRALIAGDTDRAQELATDGLQLGTDAGLADAPLFYGAQFIMVNFRRGTMGDLIPLIEQLSAGSPDVSPAFLASILAVAHTQADRIDDARHLLEQFANAGFDLPLDVLWLPAMIAYSDAAIACRDPRFAGPLFDRLAPWADQWSTTGATAEGPVSNHLGGLATILGRYGEADSYFANSAKSSERVGARFFAARTHLLWGEMLMERSGHGDREKARDLLSNAQGIAAANGYADVERHASEGLQLLGS
ncbi:MAG: AAA family ATPase [Acidimicrobiales bacterium]